MGWCAQSRGDSTILKSLNDRSLVIDVRESHSGRARRGSPWVPKYFVIETYSKGASSTTVTTVIAEFLPAFLAARFFASTGYFVSDLNH